MDHNTGWGASVGYGFGVGFEHSLSPFASTAAMYSVGVGLSTPGVSAMLGYKADITSAFE
jgi:hypothetical protein